MLHMHICLFWNFINNVRENFLRSIGFIASPSLSESCFLHQKSIKQLSYIIVVFVVISTLFQRLLVDISWGLQGLDAPFFHV